MADDLIVLKVDKAKALLASVRTVLEAKQVADVAHGLQITALRQGACDAARQCRELEIDALTLIGELIQAGPKSTGTRGQLNGRSSSGRTRVEPPENRAPSQEELLGKGGRKTAAAAQALATLKQSDPALHEKVRAGKK